MKNKVQPPKRKAPSRNAKHGFVVTQFCADYDIPRNTFNDWVANEGCPTSSKPETLRWILAHKPSHLKAGGGSQDQAQWTAADWKKFKLEWDAKTAQHKYEVERGTVHGKEACCKSLTALAAESLQPLLSLHGRVKAACPELPQAVIDRIAAEVDAVFAKIREGLK
jgi:hypothetical protein